MELKETMYIQLGHVYIGDHGTVAVDKYIRFNEKV